MQTAGFAAILKPVALRCLIVDDNAGFLTAARELLDRQGVDVVGLASTGSEALQRAHELRPDVALVDIDLGAESGFDVVRLIATTARLESLPVVLISSYAEKDFADLIAASPAVGFVSKSDLSGRAISEVLGSLDGATESRGM
jgi:two-component system, NarL family, nitrate/nitrite response regulator NarL